MKFDESRSHFFSKPPAVALMAVIQSCIFCYMDRRYLSLLLGIFLYFETIAIHSLQRKMVQAQKDLEALKENKVGRNV